MFHIVPISMDHKRFGSDQEVPSSNKQAAENKMWINDDKVLSADESGNAQEIREMTMLKYQGTMPIFPYNLGVSKIEWKNKDIALSIGHINDTFVDSYFSERKQVEGVRVDRKIIVDQHPLCRRVNLPTDYR